MGNWRPVAEIALEKLNKVYSDGTHAVRDLDLEIGDGQLVVLVGPSGCGKTSALRMVAGLEQISDGVVRIGGEIVNDLPPKNRDVAMIFQNYALYPHMTAYKNMAFGLKLRKLERKEIDRRVRDAARVLGLEEVLRKRPRTLSGGQRQRVAMGRAIVREPQAFLMDEPLSNLDAKLRVEMRAEIARIQRALAVTTIYVTHDQVEAMTLGDRVAVMRDGVLQQFDVPQALYDRPVNLFVAEFIGSPAMNLVGADLERENGSLFARFGEHRLRLDDELLSARPALTRFEGKPLILGIRPRISRTPRSRARRRPTAASPRKSTSGRTWAPRSTSTSARAAGPCAARTSRLRSARRRSRRPRSRRRARAASSSRGSAARRGPARASRSTSSSRRGGCTSSTRRPGSGSTATAPV